MNENLTPIQAIRRKCLECCNGQHKEIRECLIDSCALYEFRIGDRYPKKDESNTEQISLDYLMIEYGK